MVAENGICITSHAVGVVLIDDSSADGVVRTSRMPYTDKYGRTSIRHIMETGEKNESVRETFLSSRHEAAADLNHFDYEEIVDEPIFYEFGEDEKNPGGTHLRVWYMVRPVGKVRDFVMPDGKDTLGPITMIDAAELLKETEGRTVKGHVSATYAALNALAGSPLVFDRYRRQILNWKPIALTEEEMEAVDAYMKKW